MAPVEILDGLFFIERGYLNANHFAWCGHPPVLIDSGYKADFPETRRRLQALGVHLDRVGLIINTHSHCDHVGGNHPIQKVSGCDVAMHRVGKHWIDTRDDWATWWRYYRQEADFFTCTRALEDGDRVAIGPHEFEVLYTPGHASDGIVLYHRGRRILISSDTLWEDDMAVITRRVEGSRALFEALSSIERIAALEVEVVFPGHGPPFTDLGTAVRKSMERIHGYFKNPEKIGADLMKKITVYTLLMHRRVPAGRFYRLLQSAPWFQETADLYFDGDAESAYKKTMAGLKRRGVVREEEGYLTTIVKP